MKIDNEIIENFRKIYFEEFKEEISKDKAHDRFLRLVNLLRTILKKPSNKGEGIEPSDPSLVDEHFKNAKLKE